MQTVAYLSKKSNSTLVAKLFFFFWDGIHQPFYLWHFLRNLQRHSDMSLKGLTMHGQILSEILFLFLTTFTNNLLQTWRVNIIISKLENNLLNSFMKLQIPVLTDFSHVVVCKTCGTVGVRGAFAPPDFGRLFNPIKKEEGKLCPPH